MIKITPERQDRLNKVQSLIEAIGSVGRKFFRRHEIKADIFFSGGYLCWRDEYKGDVVNLNRGNWGDWSNKICHGGTLRTVIQYFRDFIMHGKVMTNAGLFTHWGYDESEIDLVKRKAIEIGLLQLS